MNRGVALVLDGHGWAARAVVRSLGLDGWFVLAPRGTKSARSRFCGAAVTLPDFRSDAAAFTTRVGQLMRDWKVAVVAPAEDGSLELLYETPGLLAGAAVLGGDRASALLALDKLRTLVAAGAAGFGTPATVRPERVDAAVAVAREMGLPCVIKPARSYARTGAGLTSARLEFAFSAAEARRQVEDLLRRGFGMPMVQEYVPGRSIGVAAVVRNGRVLGWGAREAYSQLPIRGGSAVWRSTVSADEPGVADALGLLVGLGFQGLGDVQYHIARDGTPTLMEIGARTYGWLPLTIAAGADLPAIAARALRGEEPPTPVAARPGLHMRNVRGELARLCEVAAPRVQLPPGARRWDVIRQLWPLIGRSMLYDGWRTGDRWPSRRQAVLMSRTTSSHSEIAPSTVAYSSRSGVSVGQ